VILPSDNYLRILRFIGKQILKEIPQILFLFLFVVFVGVKFGGRLQQQGGSCVFALGFGAVPAAAELFLRHDVFLAGGVGSWVLYIYATVT